SLVQYLLEACARLRRQVPRWLLDAAHRRGDRVVRPLAALPGQGQTGPTGVRLLGRWLRRLCRPDSSRFRVYASLVIVSILCARYIYSRPDKLLTSAIY